MVYLDLVSEFAFLEILPPNGLKSRDRRTTSSFP